MRGLAVPLVQPRRTRFAPSTKRLVRLFATLSTAGALLLGAPHGLAAAAKDCPPVWPQWQDFKSHFLQPDGRVWDANAPNQQTFSEGQSYGLFFALVADDRAAFDAIWQWSVNNLMAGDVKNTLPAWHWGRTASGQWQVLDKNSASDADLWFAYALLEAGRLWKSPEYSLAARQLIHNIETREVVKLPGLGAMMLPGEVGFVHPDNLWRLNPSYLPLPLLRRTERASPDGPWREIAENTLRMVQDTSSHGYVADWVGYQGTAPGIGTFVVDPVKGDQGSYDAIRVYMWAGMTSPEDPLATAMMSATNGLARATSLTQTPPERIQTTDGKYEGIGPYGFSAALLPYLETAGDTPLTAAQHHRAQTLLNVSLLPENLNQKQPSYYDYVLSLFGLGWLDNRYRFERDGALNLPWEKSCPHVATP